MQRGGDRCGGIGGLVKVRSGRSQVIYDGVDAVHRPARPAHVQRALFAIEVSAEVLDSAGQSISIISAGATATCRCSPCCATASHLMRG